MEGDVVQAGPLVWICGCKGRFDSGLHNTGIPNSGPRAGPASVLVGGRIVRLTGRHGSGSSSAKFRPPVDDLTLALRASLGVWHLAESAC